MNYLDDLEELEKDCFDCEHLENYLPEKKVHRCKIDKKLIYPNQRKTSDECLFFLEEYL